MSGQSALIFKASRYMVVYKLVVSNNYLSALKDAKKTVRLIRLKLIFSSSDFNHLFIPSQIKSTLTNSMRNLFDLSANSWAASLYVQIKLSLSSLNLDQTESKQ